jgi:uncharacterized protein
VLRLRRSTVILAAMVNVIGVFARQPALAQQVAAASAPQIVTSGSAEAFVPPSTASFSIGVMTSAPTAAAAGEDNARLSTSVLAALERAGLKRDEISGSQLGVRPRWEYDDKGRHPRRSAFEANNTIQIATADLSQIGNYIDAALSAGATDASEITFSAKDIEEVRHRALGQAVAAAKADAEAMARAGGGSLGDLLLLTTERINEASGAELAEVIVTGARRPREPVNTDVIPSQIQVSARVIARWRFVPATPAK